eukprot:610903-Amphidinium_carterae.1
MCSLGSRLVVGADIQRATSFEMDDHMMSALKSVRSIKMETGGSVNGKQGAVASETEAERTD